MLSEETIPTQIGTFLGIRIGSLTESRWTVANLQVMSALDTLAPFPPFIRDQAVAST